ncbi:Flagellar biosynthesis protein, FliO [Alteromonadaceae bacterium Bs31]|nr:Flagellar biosynthesis protein, FliO [Alteromonadaceae bacterium Bs31]
MRNTQRSGKSQKYLRFFYVFSTLFLLSMASFALANSEQPQSQEHQSQVLNSQELQAKETQAKEPQVPEASQQESSASSQASERPAPPAVLAPTRVLGQVVFGLIIITVIILVLAWLAKRMGYGNTSANGRMRILGNMPLGSREKAVLVEVNGKQLLLGVTAASVNCLHEFDALEHQQTSIEPSRPAEASGTQDFSGYLKKILTQGTK